jgi:hypothetical protein
LPSGVRAWGGTSWGAGCGPGAERAGWSQGWAGLAGGVGAEGVHEEVDEAFGLGALADLGGD